MRRMDNVWLFGDDHSPEKGLGSYFLVIFGVLLGIGFLAPWIGLALGLLIAPFVMLRVLYHLYPHVVIVVVMIVAGIAVILLARSYNRYKRDEDAIRAEKRENDRINQE